MAAFLIDLSPSDMQVRLGDALTVYVDAMRYPRGTENQRAPMWLEHTRRPGWRAVAVVDAAPPENGSSNGRPPQTGPSQTGPAEAVTASMRRNALVTAPILGVAYGYRGAPDQWWQQQVMRGLRHCGLPRDEITRLMGDYFELTELHIHPGAQGRGLGEALVRRLLNGRDERNVLLSTPETKSGENRAWRLYRRLGFADIIRGYRFAGDPREFAILGRALPL